MKLGLIGVGAVGSAVKKALGQHFEIAAYDKFKAEYSDFDGVLASDVLFVAVPTLTDQSNKQELAPLNEVIEKLSSHQYEGIVVIKCTVLPGTTQAYQLKYPALKLVHYPEFLTEKNAFIDFLTQKTVILGGDEEDCNAVKPVFHRLNPGMQFQLYSDPTTTELIKYTHNTFLATKVEFFNEIYDVCQKVGVSYSRMMEGVHAIGKVGENHTRIPGPDGKRGYGGMCFPKDMKAFLNFSRGIGLILPVLEAGMYGNTPRRDDLDGK